MASEAGETGLEEEEMGLGEGVLVPEEEEMGPGESGWQSQMPAVLPRSAQLQKAGERSACSINRC